MKKIIGISIIPGEFHPALGPLYLVRFDDQTVNQIYTEALMWFFDFDFIYEYPTELLGMEVSQEFIDEFGSPKV
jgi:hypothetical protein